MVNSIYNQYSKEIVKSQAQHLQSFQKTCLLLLLLVGYNTSTARQYTYTRPTSRILYGPSIAYQYQQSHALKLSFFGLTNISNDHLLKAELGAGIVFHSKRTFLVPEAAATYYFNESRIIPYVKLEVTPYNLIPKIGGSLYTFINVDIGYGINFSSNPDTKFLKGFTISAGLSLPLNLKIF